MVIYTIVPQVLFAQSPDLFNYQAAIRGSNGNPLTGQDVSIRISIVEGSAGGTSIYQESFQLTTDDRGLISLQVGDGTPISGDFQTIEWGSNSYFLQTEVDENGGNNYQMLGSSPLVSVPYAKYADKAGEVDLELKDLTDVRLQNPQDGFVLSWNGTEWTGRPKAETFWQKIGPAEIKFDSAALLSKKLTIGKGAIIAQAEKNGNGTLAADVIVSRQEFRLSPGQSSLMTIDKNANDAGELTLRGSNGSTNVLLSNNGTLGARGYLGIAGPGGNVKASMEVTQNDNGIIKSNRMLADATGSLSPLEAQIGGMNVFKVYNNGGTGIGLGSNLNPPASGLKVAGPIETLNGITADNALFTGDGSTTLHPLVVKSIANQTYLQVHASNGGVSIGSSQTPPGFGLRVAQDVEIVSGDLDVQTGDILFGDEYMKNGGSGDQIIFSGNLVSFQDNIRDLGASGKRWREVFSANGVTTTSDFREKQNIQELRYGLDEIMEMRPVSFNWKNPNTPDLKLGLIAQDLMEIVPEVVKSHDWAVGEDPNATPQRVEMDRLGVYYSDLIPVLIKSIQEQQHMIEELKQRITQLEND